MWSRPFFTALLIFALFLAVPAAAQDSAPKIGVVDIARLMRDSVPGKDGVKFIEAQQAQMQKQLDEVQAKLEKNPEDQAVMQELQRVYGTAQQKIQAEGANVANMIFDAVQKTIDKYRADNGYDILLGADATASYSKAIDVTDAILALVDTQKLEFKPLPDPQPRATSVQPAPQGAKESTSGAPQAQPDQAKATSGSKPEK